VGDGPLKNSLEDIAEAGKINNIEFTGRKNFVECMQLLQYSQFLIIPALCYEGFPMVIREAFACGKPVIASRLGAMAELVENGKTGLLFTPGDPEDLANKIKWMIEHEDACIEMGKNARKVFEEKYTAKRNMEILMEIYNRVIGDRRWVIGNR
jgi:glycosyltransferase involved in cell wall biosynthesis